jgi:pre-mRNA-splicing factor CWC22
MYMSPVIARRRQVAHELLALELITLLLAKPTDDSVEVALEFTKDIGHTLHDLSPQGLHSIFERFRGILHEGQIDKRVQFMIEGLFALRKVRVRGTRRPCPPARRLRPEHAVGACSV